MKVQSVDMNSNKNQILTIGSAAAIGAIGGALKEKISINKMLKTPIPAKDYFVKSAKESAEIFNSNASIAKSAKNGALYTVATVCTALIAKALADAVKKKNGSNI